MHNNLLDESPNQITCLQVGATCFGVSTITSVAPLAFHGLSFCVPCSIYTYFTGLICVGASMSRSISDETIEGVNRLLGANMF
jgi:hypothetical protein